MTRPRDVYIYTPETRLNGQTWLEWARELFEYENCEECGRDETGHEIAVTLTGQWFARCKK